MSNGIVFETRPGNENNERSHTFGRLPRRLAIEQAWVACFVRSAGRKYQMRSDAKF